MFTVHLVNHDAIAKIKEISSHHTELLPVVDVYNQYQNTTGLKKILRDFKSEKKSALTDLDEKRIVEKKEIAVAGFWREKATYFNQLMSAGLINHAANVNVDTLQDAHKICARQSPLWLMDKSVDALGPYRPAKNFDAFEIDDFYFLITDFGYVCLNNGVSYSV